MLRRLENVVRVGTIAEVRHGSPARCRVRCGNITTNWVPWVAGRAAGGEASMWWPPKPGEQVLLLAPGGDLLNAMALPGAYSDQMPQASDNPDLFKMEWGVGFMEHDAAAGKFLLETMSSITLRVMSSSIRITENEITIEAGGGKAVLNGKGLTVTPDVIAMGISLTKHVHIGVTPGKGLSGKPV